MADAHVPHRRPSVFPSVEVTRTPVELPTGPSGAVGPDDHSDARGTPGSSQGRSRTRRAVLGAALVAVLAGTGWLGYAGWRVADQQDPTLSTPAELVGLVRDDSEEASSTAGYLQLALAAEVNIGDGIGAVYADPAADGRSVLLFGGTTLSWRPERDLDRVLGLVVDGATQLEALRAVDAGPLGGVMKCGNSSADPGAPVVCGWADHGSIAVAMLPGRELGDSARLFRQIRDGVQTRN